MVKVFFSRIWAGKQVSGIGCRVSGLGTEHGITKGGLHHSSDDARVLAVGHAGSTTTVTSNKLRCVMGLLNKHPK